MKQEEIFAKVLADGTEVFNFPPLVITGTDGINTLRWSSQIGEMEIRIRHDGKINWYSSGRGNEGWSVYSLGSRFGDPWSSLKHG